MSMPSSHLPIIGGLATSAVSVDAAHCLQHALAFMRLLSGDCMLPCALVKAHRLLSRTIRIQSKAAFTMQVIEVQA